jgi:Yip1 domain
MANFQQAPAGEPRPSKSYFERFVGVFYSPGETFDDIVTKPDFVFPLVLLMLSTISVAEVMLAKIGMERIVRMQIEQSSRASSMSPEQMQQAIEQGARIGGIIAHGSFIFVVIGMLIIAAIGLGIVNAIFGASVKFKTAFSVTSYAGLVSLVGAVMAIALILFGDPEHFNSQNPVPANLGFFLNPLETSKPMMALASSLDIFTVWNMILLGIGFSKSTGGKAKPTAVCFSFFGLWVLWVLIKMGLAMLG